MLTRCPTSMTPPPPLELRGLWRRFGTKVAVAGIDLVVPAGSFYGLVGPNGAGKTTTLSMATGLLKPDFGTVLVHGQRPVGEPDGGQAPARRPARRRAAVRPADRRAAHHLRGSAARAWTGTTVAERTADLLDAMALEADARTLVVDYSAGMTKKVALACALVHAPRLLVLDEPFEAVDPVSAANIRDILTSYVASGGTVIVSSHVMDLVQRMCDHVAVIAGGHVLAAGTVDEVRGDVSLEERFVDLVGGRVTGRGWRGCAPPPTEADRCSRNGLRRSPWQVVGLVLGALYGLMVLVAASWRGWSRSASGTARSAPPCRCWSARSWCSHGGSSRSSRSAWTRRSTPRGS